MGRRPVGLTAAEAIAYYSEPHASSCVLWTAGTNEYGYGKLCFERKRVFAHRLAWTAANGPIPVGLVVDHVCHNEAAQRGECAGGADCQHRRCVNVEHMKLETVSDNATRSPLHYASKDACLKGHEFTPENTGRRGTGRVCRTCARERYRKCMDNITPERLAAKRTRNREYSRRYYAEQGAIESL